jgi:hypothetical protein
MLKINTLRRLRMSDKNIELMKKIIEEKQKESSKQGSNKRANKSIGSSKKAFKKNKKGGVFDK